MKILLWDIDGTLIRGGYAGLRAMNAATEAVFGVRSAFDAVDFSGRTDPWAVELVCSRHGLRPTTAQITEFYAAYVLHLRRELHNPHARICAGIPELLAHFAGRPDTTLALLTGNIAAGARVKLEHFGLWHYFRFGAFADDSGDRNQLGSVALQRAREHLRREELTAGNLVVIGDTPHDIECARAAGAHSVAVATGRFDLAELASHRPDLLVADFADPRPLIDFAKGLPGGR